MEYIEEVEVTILNVSTTARKDTGVDTSIIPVSFENKMKEKCPEADFK